MKITLLFVSTLFYITLNAQNPNLVFNGNMEVFPALGSTPDGWSSASDFGGFTQNTTDFSEGASSVEFITTFSDLMLFTTVDIPLEAGKTYTIQYSYKYLGGSFNASDNIEFSFFSSTAPFLHGTNIQDNNWNTVITQFTPTETRPDFEATIRVIPAGFESDYRVLIDDVQVFEAAPLSNTDFNLDDNISVTYDSNKQFKILKTTNITILDITAYALNGKQLQISNTVKDYSNFKLNTQSSGIYILQISTNKGQLSKKVFVN